MSWADFHAQAQMIAEGAMRALNEGQVQEARRQYQRAADLEAQALHALDRSKQRTISITAISCAALYFKARNLEACERVCHQVLGQQATLPFARNGLVETLQRCWMEKGLSEDKASTFETEHVLVAIKGGQIEYGGAPLDLIKQKIDQIASLFTRVTELILRVPLRRRGPPARETRELCRPWLLQTVPGSFTFGVRIQKAQQLLWDGANHRQITQKFFSVLRALQSDSPAALDQAIELPEYRPVIAKLGELLAPSDDSHQSVTVSAGVADPEPVVLGPESKVRLRDIVAAARGADDRETIEVKEGILRALDLDKDWLKIQVEGGIDIKVTGVTDECDDIIGPLVNTHVRARVVNKDGVMRYISIEPAGNTSSRTT